MASVKWKLLIVYILVIGVAFYVVATSLIRLVGDYTYQQRIRQEQQLTQQLAIRAAPALASGDSAALYEMACEVWRSEGERVLVVDGYGVVQADSFTELNGVRLNNPEVTRVLSGSVSSAFSFNRIELDPESQAHVIASLGIASNTLMSGLYSASIVVNAQGAGAVLLATNESDLYESLAAMGRSMTLWFVAVALVTLALLMIMNRVFTLPIQSLSVGISHMSSGDFSHRVKIKGYSEYAQLASAFNMMSEKIENLDRSRSQFVSNASHELKTPLSTMKILLESLLYQDAFDPGMTREFLTDIDKEIDRLNLVISDLLTLVNIDSGEMRLRLGDINVGDMLADTVKRLSPLAGKREIDLKLSVLARPVVEGDVMKIQQVFYNIVDNAIKYTPAGGSVNVTVNETPKSAVVKVQDTGIGIPQGEISHIFDRFYRVDKARSRETGGTGLGLSIVNQIVQLHGGRVEVQSVEDKGSTFTVTLPK